MRFRVTLAFSFLVFIVTLLVSVRAEGYPLTIREPQQRDTWIEGNTVHIAVYVVHGEVQCLGSLFIGRDARFYGTSFKFASAGAWLRCRGKKTDGGLYAPRLGDRVLLTWISLPR
jgi:hypothetical protein